MKNFTTGYMHPCYAQSLSEFGTPYHLQHSDGWVLMSPIDKSLKPRFFDARGCYPLFTCRNWSSLPKDLQAMKNDLVSIILVTDPFGDYNASFLKECFPDLFRPYKEHYIIDMSLPYEKSISNHHMRNIRKAQKEVQVEYCNDPLEYEQQWTHLYTNLVRHHDIRGIAAFSASTFHRQLKVPGLEMFRAVYKGETVGIIIMIVQGNVGYYHLSAYSNTGYLCKASYALFNYILQHYSSRLCCINLGGGHGVQSDGSDGLTRFKKGWATGTRTAYICGRIFNRPLYQELVCTRGLTDNKFFPQYRKWETW